MKFQLIGQKIKESLPKQLGQRLFYKILQNYTRPATASATRMPSTAAEVIPPA